jgi:hypothetical protein
LLLNIIASYFNSKRGPDTKQAPPLSYPLVE